MLCSVARARAPTALRSRSVLRQQCTTLRRSECRYFSSSAAPSDAPALSPRVRAFVERRLSVLNDLTAAATSSHFSPEQGRQLSVLARLGELYSSYCAEAEQREQLVAELTAAGSGAGSDDVAEFAAMLRAELARLDESLAERNAAIERCLLADYRRRLAASGAAAARTARNTLLEVRAGTGGSEAQLFAGELVDMYQQYAAYRQWKFEPLSVTRTDMGGVREAVALVSARTSARGGADDDDGGGETSDGDPMATPYGALRYEGGVHRVQRVPATEASGRLHTSTATVAVLPEARDVDVQLKPSDIRVDVFRASGAGGQHVNTTESAVRLTHLPSGITVSVQDERSQHMNRAKAHQVLLSRVLAHESAKAHEERSAERQAMVGSGERSERMRTYNFAQDRVSDHRLQGKDATVSVRVLTDGGASLHGLMQRVGEHFAALEREQMLNEEE